MKRLFAALLAVVSFAAAAIGPAVAPFIPNSAATVVLAVTTSTGNVALVGSGPHVILQNVGSATAFCEFGGSGVTAAVATGFPMQSGVVLTVGRAATSTHVACITAAGTATVYATTGEGE